MMEKRLLIFLRLSEVLDEKVEFQQVSDNPLFLPTTRTTPPPPPLPRRTASTKRGETGAVCGRHGEGERARVPGRPGD